jgi:hypothetical protein
MRLFFTIGLNSSRSHHNVYLGPYVTAMLARNVERSAMNAMLSTSKTTGSLVCMVSHQIVSFG